MQVTNERTLHSFMVTGDIAIVTIPFSALRFVEVQPYHLFSYFKRRAIRELNYIAATKIAIEFKVDFGRKRDGVVRKSITDLPNYVYILSRAMAFKLQGPAIVGRKLCRGQMRH